MTATLQPNRHQTTVRPVPVRHFGKVRAGTLDELLTQSGIPLEKAYLPSSEMPLTHFFQKMNIDPYVETLVIRQDDVVGLDPLTAARQLINPSAEGEINFDQIRTLIQDTLGRAPGKRALTSCVRRRLAQAQFPIDQPIQIQSMDGFRRLMLEAFRTFFALNIDKKPWYRTGRKRFLSREEELIAIGRHHLHNVMGRTPKSQLRAENLNDFWRTLLRLMGHDVLVASLTTGQPETVVDGSVLIETIFSPNATGNSDFMSTVIRFLSFLDVLLLEANNEKLDGNAFRLKIADIVDALLKTDFRNTIMHFADRYPAITTTDVSCLTTQVPDFFSPNGYRQLSDIAGVPLDEFTRATVMMHAWAAIGPEDGKHLIGQQVNSAAAFLEATWHQSELKGGCLGLTGNPAHTTQDKPPRGDEFGHISWILGRCVPDVRTRMTADYHSPLADPVLTPQRGGGGMKFLERLLLNKFGIQSSQNGPYTFHHEQFHIKARYV